MLRSYSFALNYFCVRACISPGNWSGPKPSQKQDLSQAYGVSVWWSDISFVFTIRSVMGCLLRRQHYVSMLMFSFLGMLLLHTSSNCYSYKSWDKSSCAYTNRLQVTELSALCLHITTKHKEHQKSICCFKSLYKVKINASDYTTLSYEYMDSGRDGIGISNPVFHAAGWIGYSEERKSFCPPGHLWDEGFNTVKPGFLLKCSSLSRASVHCMTPKQRSPKLLPKEAFFLNIS